MLFLAKLTEVAQHYLTDHRIAIEDFIAIFDDPIR